MKKPLVLLTLASVAVVGCAPANIVASKWASGVTGANAQTRCEKLDMRDEAEMASMFPKYDGWKLIYISEYTTASRFGTQAAVCFERAK